MVVTVILLYVYYQKCIKTSFHSIVVVQTVAPEGSSATEGLKEMHIGIKIVTRLNDGQTMLGARAQASWSRPGGGEHVSLGVPAEPPHLVLGVGGGGVSVQDPVALGQAQPARVTDAGVGLLLVNYLPIN